MARKRKLDKGVTIFIDRHGKERTRFRLKGLSCYLPNPATPEYREAYKQALRGIVPRTQRTQPRTVGDLIQRFYASNRFNAKAGEGWKRTVKQSLEPFRHEARDVMVEDLTFEHIEEALRRRAVPRLVEGRKFGGPAATVRFREQLIRIFDYAIKLGWIADNPAKHAELPVAKDGKGFHIWTAAEVEKFQERHPVGTKARLVMEIAFWVGLRRGDIAKLTAANIRKGRIVTSASKTGKGVDMMISPDLQAALDAMPEREGPLVVTEYGKPFSTAGLGNWFRDRCNEAGLPHCSLHGLRKSMATELADAGATQQELKAFGQWSNDAEVSVYAAGANQKMLADRAIRRVIERRTSSNQPKSVRQKNAKYREKTS